VRGGGQGGVQNTRDAAQGMIAVMKQIIGDNANCPTIANGFTPAAAAIFGPQPPANPVKNVTGDNATKRKGGQGYKINSNKLNEVNEHVYLYIRDKRGY
jgi:hypothetical protein